MSQTKNAYALKNVAEAIPLFNAAAPARRPIGSRLIVPYTLYTKADVSAVSNAQSLSLVVFQGYGRCD